MYAPVARTAAAPPPPPSASTSLVKRVLLVLLLVAIGLTTSLSLFYAMRSDAFHRVVLWLQTHEPLGALVYVGCFTLFIVFCFPSTAFELLAGYIFGFTLGLVLATTGKLVGAVLSFVIGRHVCRRRVSVHMSHGHPALQGFQKLVQKRPILVVFLTRIAFFPLAVKNYGLSALDVAFPVYFVAAVVTGLPFSAVWVYSGHVVENVATLVARPTTSTTSASTTSLSGHGTEMIVLLVGAASALLLLTFVGIYTRKYVLEMAKEEEEEEEEEEEKEEDETAVEQKQLSCLAV